MTEPDTAAPHEHDWRDTGFATVEDCECGATRSGEFITEPATAATWVVDCQRPGHPTNYAHAHPYISALCTDDDNHNACTVVGELTNVPGFCDCECHRAERVSARNEDRKPDY